MRKNRLIIPALLAFLSMQGYAQELNDSITSGKPAKYSDEVVEIGYHKAQRLEESTSSISTVYNEDFNKRSAKNIANSLFGYGTGLTTLQGIADDMQMPNLHFLFVVYKVYPLIIR